MYIVQGKNHVDPSQQQGWLTTSKNNIKTRDLNSFDM